MLEEKRKLIDKIIALDNKNYMSLKETKEYRDLQTYFNTYNFGNSIMECLIDEIDGLYIEGNIVSITMAYNYAMIKLQVNTAKTEYDINYMDIKVTNDNQSVDLFDMLDMFKPEIGVRIVIDYSLAFSGCIIAKTMVELPKLVFPTQICTFCHAIYRASDKVCSCLVCGDETIKTLTTREELLEVLKQ